MRMWKVYIHSIMIDSLIRYDIPLCNIVSYLNFADIVHLGICNRNLEQFFKENYKIIFEKSKRYFYDLYEKYGSKPAFGTYIVINRIIDEKNLMVLEKFISFIKEFKKEEKWYIYRAYIDAFLDMCFLSDKSSKFFLPYFLDSKIMEIDSEDKNEIFVENFEVENYIMKIFFRGTNKIHFELLKHLGKRKLYKIFKKFISSYRLPNFCNINQKHSSKRDLYRRVKHLFLGYGSFQYNLFKLKRVKSFKR